MPFIPPPAREAPYIALPPHVFPLRVKLRACLWVYLQWQLYGLVMGPLMIGFAFLIQHSHYTHNAAYRKYIWLMAGFLILFTGSIGLASAVWRYIIIHVGEKRNRPPA